MELSEENFKKLSSPIYDLEKEKEDTQSKLRECYLNLIDLHKKYGDLNPIYPCILVCWEIGTFIHNHFLSYPFLHFHATKGGGKTRVMKLVASCSKNGQINNSMTEAVLFRTTGMLGIDEFEGIGRRGMENLRELLNSAYKKGVRVKRMKKVHTPQGEQQVVEEFEVFRPIAMANIWGLEDILSDRTLPIRIEKSFKESVVNLLEIWENEPIFIETKKALDTIFNDFAHDQCRFGVSLHLSNVYPAWNEYVIYNDIMTHTYNNTKLHLLFEKIKKANLNGRELELAFPLFLIAEMIGEEILDEVINSITEIMSERKEEQFIESKDITFMDFVAQYVQGEEYVPIITLMRDFKQYLQEDESEDKWINTKWIGRALKRLKLTLKQRRLARGREVILDIPKAQEKIRMFK